MKSRIEQYADRRKLILVGKLSGPRKSCGRLLPPNCEEHNFEAVYLLAFIILTCLYLCFSQPYLDFFYSSSVSGRISYLLYTFAHF